ncbi:MAG: hypothetical protein MUC50_18325 [Myxococcota bacterium]|jgi:hypothetical protein|nr:hypothetical protein [Myxococcota bacterium]
MEDYGQLIGYIIAAAVFLVPRLMRLLSAKSLPAGPPPKRGAAPVASPTDPMASTAQAEPLAQTTRDLVARSAELERLCRVHGGATATLAEPIAAIIARPLSTLCDFFDSFAAGRSKLTYGRLMGLREHVHRLERTVALFELLIDQRIRPSSVGFLQALDAIAQDCLSLFVASTTSRSLPYPSRLAVVILGDPGMGAADLLSQSSLAPVVIPPQKAERIEGLLAIPHGIALDFLHSAPGLLHRLERSAPDDDQLMHLGVSFDSASLCTVLAADAIAALALGPSYCAGLGASVEASSEPRMDTVPMGLRLYATGLSIELAGHTGEGQSRLDRFMRRAESPHIPEALISYADAIARDTVAVIAASTGIGADPQRQRASFEGAMSLADELSRGALPAKTLPACQWLSGALLGFEKKPTLESRLVHEVLSRLTPSHPKQRPVETEATQGIEAMVPRRFSIRRELLAKAVIVQAALGPPRAARALREGRR